MNRVKIVFEDDNILVVNTFEEIEVIPEEETEWELI